jgi:predicted secreted protein
MIHSPHRRFDRSVTAATFAFAFAGPIAAHAQSGPTAQAAPGAASPAPSEMTLSANASTDVKQDTVHITLTIAVEDGDQTSAGKRLTEALDAAMKRAGSDRDVQVTTGSYRVWPEVGAKGKTQVWHGQAQLILQSKNFEAASALAGKLADASAITNIYFSLSREGRESQERHLLDQAANAFRERAQAAAHAFGFSGYRIKTIQLGGSGGTEAPVAYATARLGGSAAPAPAPNAPLVAGTVTVGIVVNGTVVLQ